MNIGQAAKQSGVTAKMIRYYEEIGLLSDVQRTDVGYRQYSENNLRTLNFIKHSRDLGFSSEQIKELLSLWQDSSRQSAEVKQLALKHIEELNKKITQLQAMVSLLQHSADNCAGDEQADCVILEDIERGVGRV